MKKILAVLVTATVLMSGCSKIRSLFSKTDDSNAANSKKTDEGKDGQKGDNKGADNKEGGAA
ncbi:MAG: hypothetical protein LBN01_00175 [Endomicrobium sp.]|jgi:uncharacterized protein YceK|nr:hypothetical protein [Endomicrobium sp.]